MSTGAIAGGVIAAVVVILLCIGGAVFPIVYIKRRKKCKVEITRYASINAKRVLYQKNCKQTMYWENTGIAIVMLSQNTYTHEKFF